MQNVGLILIEDVEIPKRTGSLLSNILNEVTYPLEEVHLAFRNHTGIFIKIIFPGKAPLLHKILISLLLGI